MRRSREARARARLPLLVISISKGEQLRRRTKTLDPVEIMRICQRAQVVSAVNARQADVDGVVVLANRNTRAS